jgi:hypothetical protein
MDIPDANPAVQPPAAIYRNYPGARTQGGIETLAYSSLQPPRWAIKATTAKMAAFASNNRAFPVSVVGKIRSYIAGNAIKQDIAYLLGLSAVWGKDCITLHNAIIKDILLEAPHLQLGDRIIGKGSTYEKLIGRGGASELKSFAFLNDAGQDAAGNATASSLKQSVGEYIGGNYRGAGVQVYGISIHDGYHALTLTHGKDGDENLEYHLIDNGPATSLLTGHRSFKSAQELDEALCAYVRKDIARAYRVGRNKDQIMPARIDVYEIYPPREK